MDKPFFLKGVFLAIFDPFQGVELARITLFCKNCLYVRVKNSIAILKKQLLDLMEKNPSRMFRKLSFNFMPQKRPKYPFL